MYTNVHGCPRSSTSVATPCLGICTGVLLGEIRQSQARIDAVLGLEAVKPEVLEIHQFQHIVASLIREEAPEIADKLAGRLLEMREP